MNDETTTGPGPEWAKNTLRPECPACGGYMLPCTETATGIHPTTAPTPEPVTVNGRPAETGCYIDGHWGQYGPDRMADVAESFGLVVARRDDPRRYRRIADYCQDRGNASPDNLSAEEWHRLVLTAWECHEGASDNLQEAMNDATTPGAWWGWHDGEYFLSAESDDDDRPEDWDYNAPEPDDGPGPLPATLTRALDILGGR